MKKSDFFYDLPEELIAQIPADPRDTSKLMVLWCQKQTIEHRSFADITEYLRPQDVLILNDSRVMPARLLCNQTDGKVEMEFLLLKEVSNDIWEVMVKPGKRAKVGCRFDFGTEICATIIEILDSGNRLVRFEHKGNFWQILERQGQMPLPPYIKTKLSDSERYQTVYSSELGSSAAPTAGLHFTKKLLKNITELGVKIGFVTLHVGMGTFRPVKTDDISDHKMHEEFFILPQKTAKLIQEAKSRDGRVFAVGTTSCRVLESVWNEYGALKAGAYTTKLFIYPGFKFHVIDGLITNFHLPESTLIMLVSAFCGLDLTMQAYNLAIAQKYRFFSFGDAMIIL